MPHLQKQTLFAIGLASLSASSFLAPAQAASAIYTVIDLTAANDHSSYDAAINNQGQVAVSAQDSNWAQYSFVYEDGVRTTINSPGIYFRPASINDNGQITGGAAPLGSLPHAAIYSNGQLQDLGSFGFDSNVDGINNHGQSVGGATYGPAPYSSPMAVIFENGTITSIGTLGGTYSGASAINDSGVVVGESDIDGDQYHAFSYSNGVMTDLGVTGGGWGCSGASDINASGQITGYSTTPTAQNAFFYSDGIMNDVGNLGGTLSFGDSLNDGGQVVGWSYTAHDAARHAFLYDDGVLTDLNTLIDPTLGLTLLEARDINNSGWIVADGVTSSGQEHAILLKPNSMLDSGPVNSAPAVPEPSVTMTWLLALARILSGW